jgi:hypothetical protein
MERDTTIKYIMRQSQINTIKSTHIERIKHDIRNFKRLTPEQITAMLCLTEVEKNELLLLYNDVTADIQVLINDL